MSHPISTVRANADLQLERGNMQLVDGHLNFSPTDLVNHLNCRHLTGLERERASGRIERPFFRDEAAELVAQHGHLHEQRYLEVLRSTSLVEVIEGDDSAIRAEQTEEAMRAGVDVIYQATFAHEGWSGRADFLVRVDNETEPSALGPFRYEVYDTKLARTAKATALVQLAEYSERVTRIQGVAATHVHLVLGDSSVEPFPLADIAPYHRSIRRAFLDDLDTDLLDVYPEPVENCSRCQWRPTCRDRRIADDHLSLVADLGRTQARVLEDAGIATLAQLADSSETQAVAGMQPATFRRLHHQARLQLAERTTGTHVFELLEPDGPASGLEALPVPTDHDLFFDIEGDPFLGTDGLEYLFGYVDTAGTYTDCWASSVAEEKAMLEEFVDHVTNCVEAEPSMHVFHFGHYEPTTLKRLAARHGTREHELDVLLRRELFVDLHRVTRQALRASVDSYSIKRLEVFYQDPRDTEIGSGVESAVVFEAWLGSTDREDRTLLNQIVEYNRDDCVSTLRLRGWLEDRRPELEVLLGRQAGRPAAPTVDRSAVTVQVTLRPFRRAYSTASPTTPRNATMSRRHGGGCRTS
jgi:predicted RecB family nuclease